MIARGRELFQAGSALKAREHYLANISLAPSRILHELGRTFDPHYLTPLSAADVIPSPRQAVSLYREALKYGASDAQADLDRILKANPSLR